MDKDIKEIVKRMLEIISEIESYEFYKQNLLKTTDSLYKDYQAGAYSYDEYKSLLQSVLKGKSKKDWVNYYNSYIYSLLKGIEPLLSQITYSVHRDDSAEHLRISGVPEAAEKAEAEEGHGLAYHAKARKAEKLKKEEALPDEHFVEIRRPSIISELRGSIPAKERLTGAAPGKGIKEMSKKSGEELERKKGLLSSIEQSLRHKEDEEKSEIAFERTQPAKSIFERIKEYLFLRDVRKRKEIIEKKIEKAKKQSIFSSAVSSIRDAFKYRKIEAEKARPVEVSLPGERESAYSKASSFLRSIFAEKEKRPSLAPSLPRKGALESMKTSLVESMKNAVKPKKEEESKFVLKPEEDKALKKLITNVDEINRDISNLSVKESGRPLGLRLKLFIIKFHFSMKGISKKRVRKAEGREIRPELYPAPGYMEKRIEEKMAAPEPFRKRGIWESIKRIPSSISDIFKQPQEEMLVIKKPEKLRPMKEEEEAEVPVVEKGPSINVSFHILNSIKAWYNKLAEEEKKFVSPKTTYSHSMQVEALKKKIIPVIEEESIPTTLLTEEAERIKEIMKEKKKFKIYQPSYLGSVANTLVKKVTFYLIDNFPGLFKSLYDSLRLANIQVLSNTYVNIMVLCVLISFFASFVLFSFFFLLVKNPLLIAIPKSMVMGLLLSSIIFVLFYMYPSIKAKSRERSINTNLPFAINHMSAVAGSGVPPTNMFKLLVESQEYGEIATELGKIVEYVELFGYDLLTAVRSVSLTVPSSALKEFLEGIVSTVESGSELRDYLKGKASESMLSYELERQKYLETIATYSDVYTGILIAAPLFFVVSLSLVGMLGGKLGGVDINLIIVLGAYVIIPVMNILFLLFIELTQPEV